MSTLYFFRNSIIVQRWGLLQLSQRLVLLFIGLFIDFSTLRDFFSKPH